MSRPQKHVCTESAVLNEVYTGRAISGMRNFIYIVFCEAQYLLTLQV